MTAEVAVMNQSAVALAADSAATRSETKIFSANKIFAVSKYEPVAAMIYGVSGCMQVPWETIVKEFRASLGDEGYPTVGEYGNAFFEFLRQRRDIFPESEQSDFAYQYAGEKFARIREDIVKAVESEIRNSGSIQIAGVRSVVDDVIAERVAWWGERPRRKGGPRDIRRRAREQYGEQIRAASRSVFENLPLTARQHEQLMKLTLDSWYREPGGGSSGLVLAGFGTAEIFPALVSYQVDGVLLNAPIYWERMTVVVDHKSGPAVVPFAQDDMIRLFVEGVTPAYEEFLESYVEQIISGLHDVIETDLPKDGWGEKVRTTLTENRDALLGSLSQRLGGERARLYVAPLLSIVGSLPMDELASLAESLVHLTSLRRRVSLDQETVGGPIDVAVLSRGDGLIWLKRKHYFAPELNPQFFANYYRR